MRLGATTLRSSDGIDLSVSADRPGWYDTYGLAGGVVLFLDGFVG